MNANDVWFLIVLMAGSLLFVKMVITAVTKSISSYHEGKQYWGRTPDGIPPMFRKMTDKAMSERDGIIQSLRERIEVLEKIVTDQHNQSKVRELADEIDNLKG